MSTGIFDDMPTTPEPTNSELEPIREELSPSVDDKTLNSQDETQEQEAETLPDSDTTPKVREFTSKIGDKEVTYVVKGDFGDLDDEELRLGYLRDKDYTQKRMQDAEKVKELDKKRAEIDEVANNLKSQLIYEQERLNSKEFQDLKDEDEDEYYKQVHAFNEKVGKFNAWQKSKNEEMAAQAQQTEKQNEERILMAVPDWVDKDKRQDELKSIVLYLKEQGVSDSEMGKYYNPVDIVMIRKAWQHDNIAKKSLSKNRDKTPPTSTKPNSSSSKTKPKTLEEIFYGG